jgi:Xaa-Pro aminopeptidase
MTESYNMRKPISDGELRRRWQALRGVLKEKQLDCMFTQGNNMHLGGYVRYLTDIPAEYNYFMTAFLPADDEITLLRSSGSPLPASALRGVKEVRYAPFAPALYYTGDQEAQLAIDYLRNRASERVGYAGRAMLNAGFMQKLTEALPSVGFVDITEEFDQIKALKSPEEMDFICETARVHDLVWAALPAVIKPGMYEYQARAELIRLLMNLGSEEHLMFMGTAPKGKACGMSTFQYANRRIEEGDYGVLLLEVSGPGGYYCESARNFCFGEPYAELQKAWDVAVAAQQLTADLLTPGRPAKEIVARYNEYVSEQGYCQEGRLYGHSQGYDMIERPAFMAWHEFGEESMSIRAGMNISLHPYLIDDVQTVYINDNYYVDEKGATRIHQTPPKIILL